VAGRVVLGIRLRFHHHAPQQLAIRLAFHQQAADQLRRNLLGGVGEEGLGEGLGGRGSYGSGFGDEWRIWGGERDMRETHNRKNQLHMLWYRD